MGLSRNSPLSRLAAFHPPSATQLLHCDRSMCRRKSQKHYYCTTVAYRLSPLNDFFAWPCTRSDRNMTVAASCATPLSPKQEMLNLKSSPARPQTTPLLTPLTPTPPPQPPGPIGPLPTCLFHGMAIPLRATTDTNDQINNPHVRVVHVAGLLAALPDGGVSPSAQDGQRLFSGAGLSSDHPADHQHIRRANHIAAAVCRRDRGRYLRHTRGASTIFCGVCM